MDKSKKEQWKIRLTIIELLLLIFLFFALRPIFTGNVINESCKSAWQSCPNGNSDCCSGLSCQGGTCKNSTSIPVTQDINETIAENQNINQSTCKSLWQTCVTDTDCCSGLNCQGGSCKTILTSNQTATQIETIFSDQLVCSNLEQSCDYNSDCCEGLICLSGNCIKRKIACVDSDGGKNSYLKGHASGFSDEGIYIPFILDNCTVNNELEEFYCENEIVHFELTSCPNDCENGVCKCKSLSQTCSSNLECCAGFNCINKTCISQTEQIPSSLKNKVLCTFIEYPCESNEDCCSKNCVSDWEFLFWRSEIKKCGKAKIKKD